MTGKSDTPTLRFMVGDRVVFRRRDVPGWNAGTVEELWYRNAKWPDRKPSCPYRVHQESPILPHHRSKKTKDDSSSMDERLVVIEKDTNAYIRVLKHSRAPRLPFLKGDVPLPEPRDDLAYLYRPFPKNRALQVMGAMKTLKEQGDIDILDSVEKLGEVGQIVGKKDKQQLQLFLPNPASADLQYKNEDATSITGYILPRIELRRPIEQIGKYNAEQIFDSLFPTEEGSAADIEATVRQLEAEIQTSNCIQVHVKRCQKLLNLGDAHLFLFKHMGCDRDFRKATECYFAAAMDISRREAKTPQGHLEGIPEAMCAIATIKHYGAETLVYSKMHGMSPDRVPSAVVERPMLETEQIVKAAMDHVEVQQALEATLGYLAGALKCGYYSVLTMQYGRALHDCADKNPVGFAQNDQHLQRNIQCLRNAHRHRLKRSSISEDKLSKSWGTRYGIPSEDTVSTFALKAEDILRSIPLQLFSSGGLCVEIMDLHISFVELRVQSAPICVLATCPVTEVVEIIRLPDSHQLIPFSEPAFEWIWNRVAFLIHLGLGRRKNKPTDKTEDETPYEPRIRPRNLVFRNIGGDLQLAAYFQRRCMVIPGTKVRLQNVDIEDMDEIVPLDWTSPSSMVEFAIRQMEEEETRAKGFSFFAKVANHTSMSSVKNDSVERIKGGRSKSRWQQL